MTFYTYLLFLCTSCLKDSKRPGNYYGYQVFYGAANAIRTHDLILTKDVLCQLSHSSKWRLGSGSNRRPLA